MKKIFLVLLLVSTAFWAQQSPKQWQKVIENENLGKIKTANALVENIYKKAVKKKDEPQIIKCFFYRSKYSQSLDEGSQTKIINQLKTEIKQATIPAQAILNLVYAKCLDQYYNQNQYSIGQRTKIDTLAADFLTWSKADFDKEIKANYTKSLENETVLKATPLTNFEAIFEYPTPEALKNQTLLDYLMDQNIEYYASKIQYWQLNEKDFLSNKNNLFGSTEIFTKLNLDFITNENLKTALAFYQKKETHTPTAQNQFNRLFFVYQHLLKSQNDFMEVLEKLQKKGTDSVVLQKIQLEKATIYRALAAKITHPDYNIKALALLDSLTSQNKNTNIYQLALQKKQEIKTQTLSVQLQKQLYNQENARAYVTYKNVENLKISFYKINQKTAQSFVFTQKKNDSLAQLISIKNKAIQTIQKQLVDKKDYFEYTTELLLPTLETGAYLVYFESENPSKDAKAFAYETISITNLSLLAWQNQNKQHYQVLDRKTGKPIENAVLKSPTFTITTGQNGLASTPITNHNNNWGNYEKIELSHQGDSLQINKEYLANFENFSKNETEKTRAKVQFYLDRAIYRPGQTVYYKGVAFQKNGEKSSIVANTSVKIIVYDANGTVVKEWVVVTNEFGSFSGEFALPKTGLTGNFRMQAAEPDNLAAIKDLELLFWKNTNFEYSEIDFKVEEYKRPKFEISFEPIKENFQVNQKIAVKGIAKAFAGSTISDAKVTYTVTRFTNSYARFYQREEPEILATAETTTDALGAFVVNFVAKPSGNAGKEQLPVFNYQIKASVTDSNGETHDSQTEIKVGYHSLQIKATVGSQIETKDKNEIVIETTNLNGQFLATQGSLQLYLMNPISTKFKSRIWPIPEIETISDTDFERLFPYEDNQKPANENDLGTLLWTQTINSEKDKTIPLDFISDYKSGHYKLVFTAKDNFDNTITDSNSFEIIQSKDVLKTNQLFTVTQLNADAKKDGFALVKIASSIPQLFINTTANYQSKTFFDDYISLQNNEVLVKIPLQKEFRNNIIIGFETVFENQKFTEQLEILLKEETPSLIIETASFRNKIEPGSPQTWSFKLLANKTSLATEVLASMYDQSLDSFDQTDWNALAIYDNTGNYINFKSSMGFGRTNAWLRNFNNPFTELKLQSEKIDLNWFGFDLSLSQVVVVGYGSQKRSDITGSVPMLKASALVKENALSIDQALQGRVAGVAVAGVTGGGDLDIRIRGASSVTGQEPLYVIDGVLMTASDFKKLNPSDILSIDVLKDASSIAVYGSRGANGVIIITTKKALEAISQIKTRTNLSETAFFYPNLKTDAKGNISFEFTSPEALTAWKLRLLAHNKEAVSGYLEKNVVTQKELMVVPNFPRFFREKDSIVITAKIANMTAEAKTGLAQLQFFDATTMQPIDAAMGNQNNNKNFSIAPTGNSTVSWKIYIPEGLQGIQYKIVAKAGNFSDGEESILPVLTNSMLVTESQPLWVKGDSKKEYTFENLKNNSSQTLKNHQFTLEYTSNPAWMAIQSLPYLMEYEHECAEQTFARFYANALATTIITSNPKIATVFESWKKDGKLHSKLEENEELKALILAETPWVKDAQSEDEKKQKLALLFDLEKMKASQDATFEKLKRKQNPSGGFAWFDGGTESEYITRHILAGLGHLSKLSPTAESTEKINQIAATAIPFLDQKFLEEHKTRTQNLKENQKMIWANPYSDLHFLYTRSFFVEKHPLSETLKKTTQLYLENIKENWLQYSLFEKGLAALTLNRFGEKAASKKIIESLKETASNNEDWGMYWIANKAGWYWHQAPIETQALLIEAFAEVANNSKDVDAMKVWLLKNKQTKNWPTTKATTEAVYALLLQGSDWLSVKDNTIIKIGDQKILTKKIAENQKESETGYLKLNWKADEIKKEMATISIQNKSKVPGFGGVYWQYFEDLDQIKTQTGAVLTVAKELYLKKNTDKGAVLQKITAQNNLEIGDLVTVRLVISSKEDMEFVHLKDMRASCFEPTDVLSKYEYKDRLGFYKSTKDAATHFFFDYINKGTYVLEYDLRVNNKGAFSNGITTIQSMYAPEFTSHTKGIRVRVE